VKNTDTDSHPLVTGEQIAGADAGRPGDPVAKATGLGREMARVSTLKQYTGVRTPAVRTVKKKKNGRTAEVIGIKSDDSLESESGGE